MKKHLLSFASFAVLFLSLASSAHAAKMETHILGNPKAPLIIEDYASLTCSHCASFYTQVLPEIQKRYIDTGKVAFVFRDFPLDGVSLRAASLAHCMPSDQYHSFISILYKNIQAWASNPDSILVQYAKLGGLDENKAKDCLNDSRMMDELIAARKTATENYNINSTPTFIFNNGEEKLVGHNGVEEFARIIDKVLAQKKGK